MRSFIFFLNLQFAELPCSKKNDGCFSHLLPSGSCLWFYKLAHAHAHAHTHKQPWGTEKRNVLFVAERGTMDYCNYFYGKKKVCFFGVDWGQSWGFAAKRGFFFFFPKNSQDAGNWAQMNL